MAKNDEKLIFGVGFDIATGVDEVIKQWESKESKRLQKVLDKKPLKISLEIKKNFITELRDFVRATKEVASAQKAINNAKKQEIEIASKAAALKTKEANARNANVRAAVQEATQQDQINKKKADAAYSEERLTQAKKNGIGATNMQNAAYKTQGGYLQRLITRMAAYFSIHQAFGFLRQIREVTAEFELQRVALGALIQDANKANVIFEQIKVQAIKSPYEVRELVDYTKRLAAYGVEADDLMGTMNRLADISAGLGADMNRIILAYGQIQAAGVLKGTELRQLTELGLPMVELLAQYYSTLRNEVVTTSEVFDMISKKEIPFEAVKDVLEDLTSEGGRFYEMQAVQAETLSGQWSNMKDTLSIMFDEMGRSEEVRTMISKWIDTVKWLAINWKEVWMQVKILGYTYAGLKLAVPIFKVLTAATISKSQATKKLVMVERQYNALQLKGLRALNLSAQAMRVSARLTLAAAKANTVWGRSWRKVLASITATMATNPIGWIMGIIGVISLFILKMSDGVDAMEAFRARQREVAKESAKNVRLMVNNFERLAEEVIRSEDGSQRQIQALRRLKQQYGEIFPDWKLTVDYLREISAGATDTANAFDNMAASIRTFATEEMRQTLIENYNRQLEEQFSDTFSKLTDEYGANFAEAIGEIQRLAFQRGMTQDRLAQEVLDMFMTITGQDNAALASKLRLPLLEARQLQDFSLNELKEILRDAGESGQADALLLLLELAEALRRSNGEIEDMISDFDNLDPRMRTVNEQLSNLRATLNGIASDRGNGTPEQIEIAIDEASEEAINGFLSQLLAGEGVNWQLPIPLNIDNLTEQLPNIEAQVEAAGRSLSDAFYHGLNEARALSGDYDDMWREQLADMRKYVNNGTRLIQAYSHDQIEALEGLPQALDDVAKRHKELSEELERQQSILSSSAVETDNTLRENTEQRIETIQAILEMLHRFLSMYNALDLLETRTSRSTTRNPRIEILNNELSTVERIYKEYQRLLQYMTDDDARHQIEEMFGNVEYSMLNTALSAEEMREQYEHALQEARRMGDQKQILDIEYKIGSFNIEESRREMERDIQRLADELSHTRAAREFFDRMLGLSGDRELSATLTMSVYGTTGDDLARIMQDQIAQAFRALPQDYNLSDALLEGNRYDYNTLADWIEYLPEEHRNVATQIVNNWRTSNARILEDLYQSYDDFLSFEQRKTMVVEREARERARIEESLFDDETKRLLTDASRRRQRRDIADIAVEEFKSSEDWAKSFEDLANISTPTIERLMSQLREFIDTQDDLSPEQLKTLTKEYEKLYDGLITRNPFKAIADGMEEYKASMRDIAAARAELANAEALGDDSLIEFAERGLADAFDDAQTASTKLKNGIEAVGDKFSQASADVEFFAKALGFSEDSHAVRFLTSMSDAFKGMAVAIKLSDFAMKLLDGSIKSFFTSNPIGWILLAVSGVISAIQAISNARVNRINKDIEALNDKLSSLSYAYDRLQKSAEKSFGVEYVANYERQLANLEAQLEAYEKQLSLERSKGKKSDEEKIKEYQNQIRDTKDAIEDMYGSLSEHFLGQDLASAARDFASAWIDAYKEFSNTTDAMKAKFQDMIQNMIVESLLAKVMEKALEPVFTMIDEMQDGDFYSPSFWQEVMSAMQVATENGVVGAENIMLMLEQMGVNLRGLGGEMTGISRDIATASEESILGLAAGINTQNFYISQVPTKLDTIIGLLRGGSTVVDSGVNVQDLIAIQNQFLSHLPTIAQNTAETVARCERAAVACESMASKLGSVIKPKGTASTHSVNVTIGS